MAESEEIMKVAQKRAIWYSIRRKQLERQEEYLREHDLIQEFKESKYKNMTWFLKSKGIYI